MICCKIIIDKSGQFATLWSELAKYGDCLYDNNALYFGDTEHNAVTNRKVCNIIKKSGYKNFFIEEYNKENQPNETDEATNGWIIDKLIKINYKLYEQASQELFHNISKGLDILDQEIDQIIANQEIKEEEL